MARLRKIYVAHFYERGSKHPFKTERVLADTYDNAQELAEDWAEGKLNGRVRKIKVERSRGEIIASDN